METNPTDPPVRLPILQVYGRIKGSAIIWTSSQNTRTKKPHRRLLHAGPPRRNPNLPINIGKLTAFKSSTFKVLFIDNTKDDRPGRSLSTRYSDEARDASQRAISPPIKAHRIRPACCSWEEQRRSRPPPTMLSQDDEADLNLPLSEGVIPRIRRRRDRNQSDEQKW